MADVTPEEVKATWEEQLKEAWDNSYLNPVNTDTEQAEVDKIIHEGFPVVYPK